MLPPDVESFRGKAARPGGGGLYTNNKLTLAQGYGPEAWSPQWRRRDAACRWDSIRTSQLKTRKGTGFYKVPSLKGV